MHAHAYYMNSKLKWMVSEQLQCFAYSFFLATMEENYQDNKTIMMYIHIYIIYIYIYMYIYIYICTHIYTYICKCIILANVIEEL